MSVLTSVSPATVPASVAPHFVLVGTGFTGAQGAQVGGIDCTGFTVESDTRIVCDGPALYQGSYDFVLIAKTQSILYTSPIVYAVAASRTVEAEDGDHTSRTEVGTATLPVGDGDATARTESGAATIEAGDGEATTRIEG